MAGDERLVARLRHIPETLLGDMGKIDHDSETIALAHEREAGFRQTRRRIRRTREGKGHAMPEDIVPAPYRAERTQPGSIKNIQSSEIGANCFTALDMQDSSKNA